MTEGAVPLANLEADTGLKASLFTVPKEGYVNAIMTKIASGDIPDVFVNDSASGNFPLTLQIAAPINKVSTVNLNEPIWDQSLIQRGTVDGNVYLVNAIGSPWNSEYIVYYNKVIFDYNGFKTPKEYYEDGSWTWDNLIKLAQDVKWLGDDYKGIMLSNPSVLTDSLGASTIKYDCKSGVFSNGISDDNLLKGYEIYVDMREKGLLGGSISDFVNNKCGIVIADTNGLKIDGYFKDMNPDDVGYTYLPSLEPDGEFYIPSDFRMYGICDKAPNADAAGYFIRYWLDPNNYDLTNSFLTIYAGNFYYELSNAVADYKYFNLDSACSNLTATNLSEVLTALNSTSTKNVKALLESEWIDQRVDDIVSAANKLTVDKITSDRAYYK